MNRDDPPAPLVNVTETGSPDLGAGRDVDIISASQVKPSEVQLVLVGAPHETGDNGGYDGLAAVTAGPSSSVDASNRADHAGWPTNSANTTPSVNSKPSGIVKAISSTLFDASSSSMDMGLPGSKELHEAVRRISNASVPLHDRFTSLPISSEDVLC